MIETFDISKSFGGVTAVHGLTLKTGQEIFGFLGPNGAGKTTTIRMLTGLIKPDSGEIKLCGYSLKKESVRAKSCFGLVPDPPYLYNNLTLLEFWRFAGELRQMGKARLNERIDNLVELFELGENLQRLIRGFSHGERQLAALGSALLHDPDILFLDEPMSGLDPGNALLLKRILCKLAEKGKTIFLSTHLLETAEALCHRIGIIDDGRMKACGSFESLRKDTGDSSLENIFMRLTGSDHEKGISSLLFPRDPGN